MRSAFFPSVVAALILVARPASAQELEPRPQPTEQQELKTNLPLAPMFLGSLGVVTVVVGAGFGWQADQEYDDYQSEPTEELADDVDRHAIVANILMITGGAAVIGSVLWWWLWYGDDEPQPGSVQGQAEVTAARWRPILGPGHAGIAVEF